MCGIVGYVGPRTAAPILLDGLQRLEYRGYDSAGIAILTPERKIEIKKTQGRLSVLLDALQGSTPPGYLGLGHTRWATHGEPNEINAHPHADCDGRLVVVHNGIIENYGSLREGLRAKGHHFTSETDTEVLAHLIEEEYRGHQGPDEFVTAVRRALKQARGAYALAAFCAEEPELLVGARLFSPMVVGLGSGENYLASDIPALLPYTRQALIVEDGEIVALDREGASIWNLEGVAISREPFHIGWDLEAAEKGGYPHFMLKEIYEEPQVIANALRGRLDGERVLLPEVDKLDLAKIQKAYIVACGTSHYAGLVGKRLIEEFARLPAESIIASEFRYSNPVLDQNTLVILISQSGETADTLAAFRLAKESGAPTLVVANVLGSSITRGADAVLYLQAGPEICVVATKTYLAMLAVLTLLALDLGQRRGLLAHSQIAPILQELRDLSAKVDRVLDGAEAIAEIARRYADRKNFFFIGRGWDYPSALEGALKLKEISYLHAEGYPAGELKHGPIALLDPEVPVMALATPGPLYEKIISNIQEVKARRAKVLAVAAEGDKEITHHADEVLWIPRTLEPLSPILSAVPLQLFAYYVARERGCDIDKPRNLAKSVTVE
ncbi:MAG: glutamine--fructose-6-phosphate transaminase (isomerizing) [Chloroflexi bacterium]|nr:glutamine--fructose-6-phosphate transaminase (isomerizing) [Chloroflexota bacterium]